MLTNQQHSVMIVRKMIIIVVIQILWLIVIARLCWNTYLNVLFSVIKCAVQVIDLLPLKTVFLSSKRNFVL